MGGEVSTDSKSSNGIEISQFVQILSRFYWFWRVGWVGGWVGMGVGGGTPHACMHMHDIMYDIIGNSQWDIPMGAAICMKLSCLLRIHVRACACMRACAHVHGGCPHSPTPPSTHPTTHQPPKGGGGNTQNSEISIRLELIEIIRFCMKNLFLWTFLNSSRLMLITIDTPPPTCPAPLEPKKTKS